MNAISFRRCSCPSPTGVAGFFQSVKVRVRSRRKPKLLEDLGRAKRLFAVNCGINRMYLGLLR